MMRMKKTAQSHGHITVVRGRRVLVLEPLCESLGSWLNKLISETCCLTNESWINKNNTTKVSLYFQKQCELNSNNAPQI